MAVHLELLTADDLLAMPDDGRRLELIRGELIEMPPTGHRHGRLVMRVGRLMCDLFEDPGLGSVVGESGVVISRRPDTVRAPDVSVYLGTPTSTLNEPEGYLDRLPDLIFEVVSPSDTANDVDDKVQSYLEAGVPLVVAVWPRRSQLTVFTPDGQTHRLSPSDELELGSLVAGLRVQVSAIFE